MNCAGFKSLKFWGNFGFLVFPASMTVSARNTSVTYPFGINHLDCAINRHFNLQCNKSLSQSGDTKVIFRDFQVMNISVEGNIVVSILAAYKRYNKGWSSPIIDFASKLTLEDGPFMFSNTQNKLTAFRLVQPLNWTSLASPLFTSSEKR